MQTISPVIKYAEHRYTYGWSCPDFGAVIGVAHTLQEAKDLFLQDLTQQIKDMSTANEPIPQWLVDGQYNVEFDIAPSALLRDAERYTTMAALSRVTGINQKLLSHYANAVKVPRSKQRQRIVDGLHAIGRACLAMV